MIAIINTGTCNAKSIQNMLKRLGTESVVTNSLEILLKAEKIILPGIGSFDSAVQNLKEHNLWDALKNIVLEKKIKILGICLGMQLLADSSEEGNLEGLGLIKGTVNKIKSLDSQLKVPHMGWGYATKKRDSILLSGFDDIPRFYFTHSYYFNCNQPSDIAATTEYGINFTSVIERENIMGVQFHPEKSHRYGLKLLENFVKC